MKIKTTFALAILALISAIEAFALSRVYSYPTSESGQAIERPIYTLNNKNNTKFIYWVAYIVPKNIIDRSSHIHAWRANSNISSAYKAVDSPMLQR